MPFEEKKYYCTESGNSYTVSELIEIWKNDNCKFQNESFHDWLNNCMYENNGTLIKAKEIFSIREHGRVIYSVWSIKTDLEA